MGLNYEYFSSKPSRNLYIYNQIGGKMTKQATILLAMLFLIVLACQNEPKSAAEQEYDNYYDSVMLIHDRTMPMMGHLEELRTQLQEERRAVINADPNRYRKVVNLLGELNKAEDAMFTWMNEFNPDSIPSEQKLNYIKSELGEVKHMEGLMLGGIGMAESYLEEYVPQQQ